MGDGQCCGCQKGGRNGAGEAAGGEEEQHQGQCAKDGRGKVGPPGRVPDGQPGEGVGQDDPEMVAEDSAREFNFQEISHRLEGGEISAAPEEAGGQSGRVEGQRGDKNEQG